MLCPEKTNEGLILPGSISIPFSYAAGRTASRFLTELRDNRRIMGVRCPVCSRVWVAPQRICIRCFVEADEWVDLGTEGRLLSHTEVKTPKSHHPTVSPLIYGIIRFEGADNSFVHMIHCDEPDNLADGIKVRAIFTEKRKASILDILYFRPIDRAEEDQGAPNDCPA